ncbi:hypothetical protein A3770_01p03880 [Chloropicon primus]|uniref:Uncharacterized protein n=1 Tax=Chloropicon primus TaxID=1764295 RepID=A0A5B8MF19_9CHLO|nr:hypothetical protein A3770_01p03880 [Chloropicon primus]|eukprot:QDZ17870.1 hypothetical protein A3770_01p03880 [Chloropicon primus]
MGEDSGREDLNPLLPNAYWSWDHGTRDYLRISLHLVIVTWVILLSYWFWNVFLRKGQVFFSDEVPTGGRISAPSKVQRCITLLPLVKLFSCICLASAVGRYDYWKNCNPTLSVLVMLGSVLGEIVVHAILLRVSYAWCILENEITVKQRQRFNMLLTLLFVSTAGYHFGVPFLFTTLVMVYCTILTLEFHSIVLNHRKLREALGEQLSLAARRGTNDVASALIEQMKVQMNLLISIHRMLVVYLTAQIMINGPLYLFIGRQVAVCIARHVMDLGIFTYFLIFFSECHVNVFPYVALPRNQLESGRDTRRRENLSQPEVWIYYTKDVVKSIQQLTNGDLSLGRAVGGESEREREEVDKFPLSLVSHPSAFQYHYDVNHETSEEDEPV